MSDEMNAHAKFPAILVRAVFLALIYPLLKGVYAGWASLAAHFPGRGVVPFLLSGAAFLVFFILLGWLLGTKPVKWLKKSFGKLWRYMILNRFSALENGKNGQGSWRGKEVLFAEEGRFGEEQFASIISAGVVTADYGEWVAVFIVAPPGGTSRIFYTRKRGGRLLPTNRPVQKHAETFVTLGNGLNPADYLPPACR